MSVSATSPAAGCTVAELSLDAPSVRQVAGRPLVHHWPLIQSHARSVLLPPHCAVAGRRVSWSWDEPAGRPPLTTAEMASLRTRLRDVSRRIADAAAVRGKGELDPSTREILVATAAVTMALAAKSDRALGAYTARTPSGLRLHSWGSTVPARPRFRETQELEIAGTVIVRGKPDGGHRVVLEDARGGVVAKTRSDSQGRFLFGELVPGRYRVRGVPEQVDFPVTGLTVELSSGPVRGLEVKSSARRGQKGPAKKGEEAPADTVTAAPPWAERPTEPPASTHRRRAGWIVAGGVVVMIFTGTLFMSRREVNRSAVSEWVAPSEVASVPGVVQRTAKRSTIERLAARDVSGAVTTEGGMERVLDNEAWPEAVREEEIAASAQPDSPTTIPSAEEGSPDDSATARRRSPGVPGYAGAAASAANLAAPAAGAGLLEAARSGASARLADLSVANAGGGQAFLPSDAAIKAKSATSAGEPAPGATSRPGASVQNPTESAVPLAATPADSASKPRSRTDPDPATRTASKPALPPEENRRFGKAVGPRSAAAGPHEPSDGEDLADPKTETREDHADAGDDAQVPNAAASLRRTRANPRQDAASAPSASSTSATEGISENPVIVERDSSRRERPPTLQGLPSSSSLTGQRWEGRLRRSPWGLALTRDVVVFTRPVAEGQVDSSEMNRLALLKQKQAEVSPGFSTASFAWGVAIALDERMAKAAWRVTSGRSAAIERREGGRVVLVLPATPLSGTRYELQTLEPVESLARLEIDQGGRLRINVVPGLRAAFWFSAEPKPSDIATENHAKPWPLKLQWRLLDGQPLPDSWRERHHQANEDRRSWLEIPLEKAEEASRSYPVALVDPVSGWAWRSYLQFE